jgi:hypothetical protein
VSNHDVEKPTDITIPEGSLFRKLPIIGGVVGVAGLGATLAAAMGPDKDRAMFSYLWAYIVFLGLALAPLIWLCIDTVARGGWSAVVKRIAETMGVTVPMFALLWIPIGTLGYHSLFPWTHEHDIMLDRKRWFLHDNFFYGRAVVYFVAWTIVALVLYRASVRQDSMNDKLEQEKLIRRVWKMGAGGVPLMGVTLSFAAIDWLMSLQPHWYSTIFGVYFFAASTLAFFAVMTLMAMALQKAGALKNAITTEHYHDLGKWTFGWTIFWAYIAFSQFVLIWYANMPEETEFYMVRLEGGWHWVSYLLPVLHFFLPFGFLLSRHVKRNRKALAVGAVWTVLMYLMDMYWLILPNYGIHGEGHHEAHFALTWTDGAALLGMGGLWLAVFSVLFTRNKVVGINDPRLPESLVHENF